MTLAEYTDQNGLTDAEIAARCGVAVSTIWRARTGETFPSPDLVLKIAEVTGGAVVATDWYAQLSRTQA